MVLRSIPGWRFSSPERCLKYLAGVAVADLRAACWKLLEIEILATRGVTVSQLGRARRAGAGHGGESGGGEYILAPHTAVVVLI